MKVRFLASLSHIVSVVCQNAELCPPLKAPLGEDDEDQGGEEEEKHLPAWDFGKLLTQVGWVDVCTR